MLAQAEQTRHAALRMAQRHVSYAEVEYVMRHGVQYHSAGVLHCYLRRKDIPQGDLRKSECARLEGTTVLLDGRTGAEIITVYRNRSKQALKAIRRKAKYDRAVRAPAQSNGLGLAVRPRCFATDF